MFYPTLTGKNPQTVFTDVFGGYNHNERIGDGEFYDMQNLTSSKFPMLSVRGKTAMFRSAGSSDIKMTGLIAKNTLCYTASSNFCICKEEIDSYISMGLSDSEKTLVSMGAYVIILPDKKYINVENPEDRGDIAKIFDGNGKDILFNFCEKDGKDILEKGTSTPPSDAKDNDYWLDISDGTVLKQYNAINESWISVSNTFVKISADGIDDGFSVGDTVEISGVTASQELLSIEGYKNIVSVGQDYIVVSSDAISAAYTQTGSLKISRGFPDLDFVIESNNRLWGCKYGMNNGEMINEIYASKLGDFKNWHSFEGISTDSYAATVGSDGAFTGAVSYLGYPIFFKENCLHKVYGNFPSNFSIQTTECRGVQKGSAKSLAIVNEILFYKSINSICAYDGSFPSEISQNLGDVYYKEAVAGAFHHKYYISMQDGSNKSHLFVYDTSKGIWHKEDNIKALAFEYHNGDLFYINKDYNIISVSGNGIKNDDFLIPWFAETANIGISYPNKRYLKQVKIKISLEKNSRINVLVNYDSTSKWEKVYSASPPQAKSLIIPIKPRRCDHFKIKIQGEGDATLYSITRVFIEGSDK